MRTPLWSLPFFFLIWCGVLFYPVFVATGLLWQLAFPLVSEIWWVAVSAAFVATGAAWFTVRIARDNPPWLRCSVCEYDLTGLPAHTPNCPECGSPIGQSNISAS